MFRKKIIYALSLLLLVCSCNKQDKVGQGQVSLYIETNTPPPQETVVAAKTTTDEPMIFTVKVLKTNDQEVISFPDHTQMPRSFVLPSGSYKIVAYTTGADFQAAFDTPIYYGETNTSVSVGTNTNVKVSCSHALIKVAVSYSDEIKSYLSSYKTVVSNGVEGGELTFEGDDARIGYFKPTTQGNITYTLHATTNQGRTITASRTVSSMKAADFLSIYYNVDNTTPEGDADNTLLDIIVDETLNDVVTDVMIYMEKGTAPQVSVRDLDITTPITVRNPVQVPVLIDITIPEEMIYLGLKFNSDLCQQHNISVSPSLMGADAATLAALNEAGISFTVADDKKSAVVDLTNMTSKLSFFEDSHKDHFVELVAIDKHKQYATANMTFRVFSKQHKVASGQLFERDAQTNDVVIKGVYVGEQPLAGTTFVYKSADQNEWTIVPSSAISFNGQTKEYSCTLQWNIDNVSYEVRSAIVSDNTISELGDGAVNIPNTAVQKVPNLSFDEWHSSGKSQYPNASGGNSFWATGNDGITGFPVNKDSNTFPIGDDVVSGKAVKMTSISVPVVNFAAGNLFTGTYKTNISNPAASVNFGREFSGRPTHLTGYYKYAPAPYNGGKDYCHIYILLENRSSGTTRVGYVEMKDNNTTTAYQKFSMKINYQSDLPVTHITLVATSSHEGGDFKGGVGSTLWVDEFDLLYLYE